MRLLVAMLLMLLSLDAARGATAMPAKVEPELAPNADLLAKIAALPDNTWMKLPPLKTTGDMGVLNKDPDYKYCGPMVRDYCNKMVWAPDRKRAMYCGGGHNVNPYNDVWEYDLASNTWVCLYGADPAVPNFAPEKEAEGVAWYKEHAVIKDGVVRTPRGGPLRALHTWWSLCYDSDQKRMLFMESHKGLGFVNTALLAKAHNLDPKDPLLRVYGSVAGEASLFSFYAQTREWKEVLTKVPKANETSCLEYLPESKAIWWLSGKTYTYDASNKQWKTMLNSKDEPERDAETAYDPESKKVVATVGLKTWVYSCDTERWTLAQENAPDGAHSGYATFCYDSVAKKFVLYTFTATKDKPFPDAGARLWLYDVKENKWTDPAPRGECSKALLVAGYYDPERNVTVIYNARETWVYRCKRAAK
jgi:hypothetical protein